MNPKYLLAKLFRPPHSLQILLVLLAISLPTFAAMLRFGIFSMHDFHVFRMYEFYQCFTEFELPCRWSANSGFGYGEPLFNFYPQVSYWVGLLPSTLGLSIINSVKFSFIFSLFASSLAMYSLCYYITKSRLSSLISATSYIYAPYRAVDVWVRGALPESMAFVLFPLIVLYFEKYLNSQKYKYLALWSLSLGLLALTHNLSLLMFSLFMGFWAVYRIISTNSWTLIPKLFFASLLAIGVAAFQLLPVAMEMRHVTLSTSLEGYYDFRAHFVTLNQLFVSRHWGYGASVWGNEDNISFSVGQAQVAILIASLLVLIRQKRLDKLSVSTFFIFILSLFLTHNKSTPVWTTIHVLERLQFPWRWLSLSTFTLALLLGLTTKKIKPFLGISLIILIVSTNYRFFTPDRWFSISDEEQFAGNRFIEQTASALSDFWPASAEQLPNGPAPLFPIFNPESTNVISYDKYSHKIRSEIKLTSPDEIVFPLSYFPGWKAYLNGKPIDINPKQPLGLVSLSLPSGTHSILIQFEETPVRKTANIISLFSLLIFFALLNYSHSISKSKVSLKNNF